MNTAAILTHAFGWALLHSLWQGLLLFIMLRLLYVCAPKASAELKHRAAYGALVAMAGWFVLTFIQHWQKLQAVTVKIATGNAMAADYKISYVQTIPQGDRYVPLRFFDSLNHWMPYLIMAYGIGVCFFALRLILNLMQVNNLRTKDTSVPATDLLHLIGSLQQKMDLSRKVKLLLSSRIQVPLTFGTFKPIILLPLSAINNLTPDQLEAILIHELAHIRRYDYLLNILQIAIEIILFFNPATWLISGIIRREREHCCDDYVLSLTAQPLPYAQALATLETLKLQSSGLALAADGHKKNHLFNRIKRIMEMKKQQLSGTQVLAIIALVTTLVASAVWFSPAIAQSKKQEDKKETIIKREVAITKDGDEDVNVDVNIQGDLDKISPEIKKQMQEAFAKADPAAIKLAMEQGMAAAKLAHSMLGAMDTNIIRISMSEASKAIKDIDWEEIGRNVNDAMKEVDWKKIDKEITLAMTETDKKMSKHMADADKAMAEADKATAEADKAMEAADRAAEESDRAMEQADRAMEEADRHMNESIDERRRTIKKRVSITNNGNSAGHDTPDIEPMLDKMQQEGLINRKKGFEIEKKKGTLYIDGIAQDDATYRRYARYLDGDKIKIEGDEHNLSVDIQKGK